MSKQISFSHEARQALVRGVDQLANAVKVTLGPKGKNVLLDKGFGASVITKDGVSVAKDIELEDVQENLGVQLVKQVANNTNDSVGDGTTTATVLAQSIITEGMKNIIAGTSSVAINRGLEKAAQAVKEYLFNKVAKPVKPNEIANVASVSANDTEIGEYIAKAIKEVGQDGVITVEESQSFGIEVDTVKGMRFDKGYVSPYMVTNEERMEAEYLDAPILLTNKILSNIEDLIPVLEKLAAVDKRSLVIIADNIEGQALATIAVNNIQGKFKILAIKAPGFGDNKKDLIKDIASLTGATPVMEGLGMTLPKVELSHLGKARKVVSTKDHTTIIDGAGKHINKRAKQLKEELRTEKRDILKKELRERIAKLVGGVAVIKVGAATETEMKEKKDRIEDAVGATKAAVEEGVVPGGGVALIRASKALDTLELPPEEQIAISILRNALEAPIKTIASNAGYPEEVILQRVKDLKGNNGFNAETGEYEDMVKAGVIDPAKVTRVALENAVSIARMILSTEAVVSYIPVKE